MSCRSRLASQEGLHIGIVQWRRTAVLPDRESTLVKESIALSSEPTALKRTFDWSSTNDSGADWGNTESMDPKRSG